MSCKAASIPAGVFDLETDLEGIAEAYAATNRPPEDPDP